MAVLDSIWIPTIKAARVGRKPVDASFQDHPIVLFRTTGGKIAAIQRNCPHRGHDLTFGKVKGGSLHCPYHGWNFGADGLGRSPGNPKTTCAADAYETAEALGYIWVRTSGEGAFEDSAAFRALDVANAPFSGVVAADFDGPISVVVDNFNEIEHTGPVHGNFGYPTNRLDEVQIGWDRTQPGHFEITSFGPQKPLPWVLRAYLGLGEKDYLAGDWTTTVRPWISNYVDRWYAGSSRNEAVRAFGLDLRIFFVPLSEGRTRLFTFIFCSGLRFHGIAKHVVTGMIRREVSFDQKVVSRLYDAHRPIVGRRLARFDAVLHQIRQDAEEIYS